MFVPGGQLVDWGQVMVGDRVVCTVAMPHIVRYILRGSWCRRGLRGNCCGLRWVKERASSNARCPIVDPRFYASWCLIELRLRDVLTYEV